MRQDNKKNKETKGCMKLNRCFANLLTKLNLKMITTSQVAVNKNKHDLSMIADIRSSRPEVFCKKGVLRNFTKFTGKHLCQSLFLIKLQA